MSTTTEIEWTDKTWNPTTGCDKVSPGCDHCYALTLAKRLKGMGSAKYQLDGDPRTSGPGFLATEHESELVAPLRWRKPAKVFVNSMSDLFHERISDEFIARVFAVMAMAKRHTFQLLTKRHGRMRALLSDPDWEFQGMVGSARYDLGDTDTTIPEPEDPSWGWPLPNVWLGVSVEDQKRAELRIPALLDTPAAVRFLSCEPLLGPVRLPAAWLYRNHASLVDSPTVRSASVVDWLIVGGESGPGARPMHPEWARSLRDQCSDAGVPFHFKQRGEWTWAPQLDDPGGFMGPGGQWSRNLPRIADLGRWSAMWRVGKHRAGRELDGCTWDEFPEVSR